VGWFKRTSKPVQFADLISPKQGKYDRWRILWDGRIAYFDFCPKGHEVAVIVRRIRYFGGDAEICRIAKPEGESPWSEAEFEHDGHRFHVISVWHPDPPISSLVFVDGVCLRDGRTLDTWQMQRPLPTDRYEQMYQHLPMLHGIAAVFFAASFVLGMIGRMPSLVGHPVVWLGTPVLLVASLLAIGRFAYWLLGRRNLNATLRTLLLGYAFVAVWLAAVWLSIVLILNF
jgi:hypothetical protein